MVEIMQQVINVLVNDVLAPAVARTGDLDGAVQNIKFSVANYVHEAGLPPEILAKHFGKSERSIYRYFEQMGKETRKADAAHEGVQLMMRILEFYYTRKDALPPDACIRYLRRHDPSVSPSDITGLLDLYATMGHLRKITEEEGGSRVVRYQAPEQLHGHQGQSELSERLRLASRKLRALLPLILSYARQEEGSTMMLLRGRVSRRHLVEALADINAFSEQRWRQAREDSEREDPDGRDETVEACTLVLGGPGAMDDALPEREPIFTAAFPRIPNGRVAAMHMS
jgi:hypothetical protein